MTRSWAAGEPRSGRRRAVGAFGRTVVAFALAGAVLAVSGAGARPVAGPVPAMRLVKDGAAAAPMPAQCGADGSGCLQRLGLGDGATVSAYANFPLTGSTAPTHALVVIEGGGRDGAFTFAGMVQAAQRAGVSASTLVVAPWFKTAQDQPAADEARWSSGGWKIGDSAQQPQGLSSFAVVDAIFATLANHQRFPRMAWLTLTGHSSGGQFTDRYASLSTVPDRLGVPVNYVVANPSSFLNYDSTRPVGPGGEWTTPNSGSCPGYDSYKYGMTGRAGYAAQLTPQQAQSLFLSRRVTILSGGADDHQNGDMDASCAGNLEGPNRVTRAANYFARMRAIAPTAPHDRIVVPGVDHDHLALFDSPLASMVLFGVDEQPAAAGGS